MSARPLTSSIGKKLVTGATGLALMAFVVVHLLGNLTLFAGADAFNGYTHALEKQGMLLVVAELGLLALFLAHVASTVAVSLDNRRARTTTNTVVQSKGAPSRQTIASRSMLVTGIVLLGFTILHVASFRFGPSVGEGYVTTLHGESARDLHRLVVETFQKPPVVGFYVAVMMLLGLHLRHGFWSAFQTLGALSPRLRPLAFTLGVAVGTLLAVGFLVLPVWIYLYVPVPSAAGVAALAVP